MSDWTFAFFFSFSKSVKQWLKDTKDEYKAFQDLEAEMTETTTLRKMRRQRYLCNK